MDRVDRPLSPLGVYRSQITSSLSILHRTTGLAISVGVKALEIYQRRDILGHVRKVAPKLQAKIRPFADHPLVGEARGVGLMGALELPPDKAKAAPFKSYNFV